MENVQFIADKWVFAVFVVAFCVGFALVAARLALGGRHG